MYLNKEDNFIDIIKKPSKIGMIVSYILIFVIGSSILMSLLAFLVAKKYDVSAITHSTDCAHQVLLSIEPDEKGKKQLVEKGYLYYSDAEDSRTEINNVLCKLGNYDAKIVIKKDSNNTVIVDVRILRGNTVYYSEERTVELKNNVVFSGTDDTIIDTSKETSKILYIGSLE